MVEHGYDPAYGARPVKRVMQRELVNLLAKSILDGTVHKDSVLVANRLIVKHIPIILGSKRAEDFSYLADC